ncbi:MAG TPA: efflux RND transporter permease subunit [Prolixibacteraceae bacterium]|nr:efflux RND transporter permease subunit [Prolixibacteraceae bacterium]
MKKIVEFSIKYPVTILMMVLAVLLMGYISFSKLGVDLFPEMNNPNLYIELKVGNRPPEEIENLYVKNIESQAVRQSGVANVSSVTEVGFSRITVEYKWGKDMDEAFLDLQKVVTSYSQNSDIDAISITQNDPNSSAVMVVAMSNDNITNLDELRTVAQNYIRNELVRVDGIADVKLSGDEVAEVLVETNPYLLEAYGLSASTLSSKIQSYNRNVSGGSIEENGLNYSIKGVGMISGAEDLAKIIVGLKSETQPDGTFRQVPVYLHDVAKISVKNKDPETIVRLNGNRCIGLSIYKEPKYNTVKAVKQLNEAFETIRKALPGYSFTVVKDQGKFIDGAVNEVKSSALIGMILAIAVLFVFLRRVSTTLVIGTAIPISIVATFVVMYFMGLSLNIMTLGGLALGAGMLVDNAIIVVENIFRHYERDKNIFKASVEGTVEVGGAVTASTLTTVVVFLPIVYLQGASGQLFKDMALTVTVSLLASLLVSIMIIPLLSDRLLGKSVKPVNTLRFNWYPNVLNSILNNRWKVIVIALLAIVGSLFIIPHIGSEFMPQSASGNVTVQMNMPEGTRLKNTSAAISNVETMLRDALPAEIASVYTQVGDVSTVAGSSVETTENRAVMYVTLTDGGAKRYNKVLEVFNKVMSTNPEIEFSYLQEDGSLQSIMGSDEPPLVVEVVGDDLDVISDVTARIKEVALQQQGLYNVESSIENGAPEILVKVDRARAGALNLGVSDIITQVKNRLEGVEAGEYEQSGEMRDITIRQPDVNLAELANLEITSGSSKYLLTDVATLSEQQQPREINRSNQSRVGKVNAYVESSAKFDHVVKELQSKLAGVAVPDGYRVRIAGEELKRQESMSGLTFALILSIILVYMVMAAQFESLIHPFTVLLTIPLALVGSIVTFFLLGDSLNIMAYIGMIMLGGIAVNDSIILIDAIIQLRNSGMSKREAILQAGHNRIRPILMTSLTTILGLVPLTFSFGESASLRSPMAWAVIGGLTTSTILSLVVIPCVYDVMSFRKEKVVKENSVN